MKAYVLKTDDGWYFCELKAKNYGVCLEITTRSDYATKFTRKNKCDEILCLLKALDKKRKTEHNFKIIEVEK